MTKVEDGLHTFVTRILDAVALMKPTRLISGGLLKGAST